MKKIIKKIIWSLKGGYKPKEFWDSWAGTFMDDNWQVQTHAQHKWILSTIKEINPQDILEVGCGFGRNIKFLIENDVKVKKITGCDISPKMIKKAKEYVLDKSVDFIVADVLALPFKDRSFDLVLVHGLFMHIKPKDLERAISEVLRIGKKALINVEQNYNGNEYTFVHDYKKLYKKLGAQIEAYVCDKKGGLDYFYVKVR